MKTYDQGFYDGFQHALNAMEEFIRERQHDDTSVFDETDFNEQTGEWAVALDYNLSDDTPPTG